MPPSSLRISDKLVGIASVSAILVTLASYVPAPPILLALGIISFGVLYLCVGQSDRGLAGFCFAFGVVLGLIPLAFGGTP